MPPAFVEKEKSAAGREIGLGTVPVRNPEVPVKTGKKIPPKAGLLAEKIRQKYGTDSEEWFFLQKVAPYLGMKYCKTGTGSDGKQGINCANLAGRALYGINYLFFETSTMYRSSATGRISVSQLENLKSGDVVLRPDVGSREGHAVIIIANELEEKRAVIAEAGSKGVVLRHVGYAELSRTFSHKGAIGMIRFDNAATLVAEMWSWENKEKAKGKIVKV